MASEKGCPQKRAEGSLTGEEPEEEIVWQLRKTYYQ
jgi:hypothetical protein